MGATVVVAYPICSAGSYSIEALGAAGRLHPCGSSAPHNPISWDDLDEREGLVVAVCSGLKCGDVGLKVLELAIFLESCVDFGALRFMFKMVSIFLLTLFTGWAAGALHHLFVGTVDGSSLYALEMDDMARTLTMIRNMTAAGASPSITFDVSGQVDSHVEQLLNHTSAPSCTSSAAVRQMELYPATASRPTSH